jgi:hypothetical protein
MCTAAAVAAPALTATSCTGSSNAGATDIVVFFFAQKPSSKA